MANLYEIITIISPAESDDGVEAIIGGLRQQLTNSGADVLHVDKWGRRKLAYPIQKHEEGHYVLIHAEGGPNIPGEYRAHTKIRESIIRELVIKLEDAQAADTRKKLAEIGPDDAEEVAHQLEAAEQRLAAKRAALAGGATPAQAEALIKADLPEGVTEAAVIEAAADAVEAAEAAEAYEAAQAEQAAQDDDAGDDEPDDESDDESRKTTGADDAGEEE